MSPMKPETLKLVNWVKHWLTKKGYQIQPRTPWKHDTPTIVYALDDNRQPVFGVLGHLVTLNDLVQRLSRLMTVEPRPIAVYIFLPRNAPHEIEVELKGKSTYGIHVIEGPDFPYDLKHYDNEPWESAFSVSLSKRDSEGKE